MTRGHLSSTPVVPSCADKTDVLHDVCSVWLLALLFGLCSFSLLIILQREYRLFRGLRNGARAVISVECF